MLHGATVVLFLRYREQTSVSNMSAGEADQIGKLVMFWR